MKSPGIRGYSASNIVPLEHWFVNVQQSHDRMRKHLPTFVLCAIAGVIALLPSGLPVQGRFAIFSFLVAAVLWTTTSLNSAYIALGAVMLLLLMGSVSQEQFFASLGSDVIWLMIGSFILGEAVKQTGLAIRLTELAVSKARNVRSLFWLLTALLIPLTFLIPSTSGRAAVTYPIFRSITTTLNNKQINRAICLLIPTIILVSTIASLTGAGSHLITQDLLEQITKQHISFTQWMLYGLPFAAIASFVSCWIIMRMFVDSKSLQQPLEIKESHPQPLSKKEYKTLAVILLMVALWFTEAWHGLEIATVTVLGAFLLTMPKFGVIQWKDAVKAVSWTLILFIAATFVLGRALTASGVSQWMLDHVLTLNSLGGIKSHALILAGLTIISLTSHIYMTSHTARAATLVPPLLYLAIGLGLNPVAVLFLSTVGMDYCLTFPVSSKALLFYHEADDEFGFQAKDLLRLSSILIGIHFGLIILFYYTWWHWVGLSL